MSTTSNDMKFLMTTVRLFQVLPELSALSLPLSLSLSPETLTSLPIILELVGVTFKDLETNSISYILSALVAPLITDSENAVLTSDVLAIRVPVAAVGAAPIQATEELDRVFCSSLGRCFFRHVCRLYARMNSLPQA
jgi:hypothetical protein